MSKPLAAGNAAWLQREIERLEAAKKSAGTISERRHIANQINNLKHQVAR